LQKNSRPFTVIIMAFWFMNLTGFLMIFSAQEERSIKRSSLT
jgi:hypothetical protein